MRRDLDPTLRAEEGAHSAVEVLELRVVPPTGQAGLDSTDWTGIALPLSNIGLDFTSLEAVEMWVNDFRADHSPTRGTLRVELGRFDEDAFWDRDNVPNGKLDTEDKNLDGRLDRRDPNDQVAYLSEDEDTGFDGVHDELETGSGDPSDPNQDNYQYTSGSDDYSTINNTEDNALDDANAVPDTEDLNHDAGFGRANDYFEASIDLSDSQYVAIDVPVHFAGDPDVQAGNGWRLFRVPVSAFGTTGDVAWSSIQGIRFVIDGLSEPLRIQVGGIRFVGIPSPILRPRIVLHQNRPNPFNPTTTIQYELRDAGHVRLEIFDVAGRRIRTVIDRDEAEGNHFAAWNGRDDMGRPVPSGVYLYRVQTPAGEESRRMVLLK